MRVLITSNTPGYERRLVFSILKKVSPSPVEYAYSQSKGWQPDLTIIGANPQRALPPKGLVSRIQNRVRGTRQLASEYSGLTLFHTGENKRYSSVEADYSISFDLGVENKKHFRMPLWWECIDWAEDGVETDPGARIAKLFTKETLCTPLGRSVLKRPIKAALITTHLHEPRASLLRAVEGKMPVGKFGSFFDTSIGHHNSRAFYKDKLLADFAFCLCPENSMYPGYYTEKVPEAYGCGTIPITWADQNITNDFQAGSFINMADFASRGYESVDLHDKDFLQERVETPLLREPPTLEPLFEFLSKVCAEALQ